MKKKLIILALVTFIVGGTALAFTIKLFHPANLYYFSTSFTCKTSECTDFNTGTFCTRPADFLTGYYTTSDCSGSTVNGYETNAQ